MQIVLQIIATKKKSSIINGDCNKADVPIERLTPIKKMSNFLNKGVILKMMLTSTKPQNISMVKAENISSYSTMVI